LGVFNSSKGKLLRKEKKKLGKGRRERKKRDCQKKSKLSRKVWEK